MTSFVESASHSQARKILGTDFHGVDAAIRCFGDLSDDAIAARLQIRLRDHRSGELCSEEDAMRLLEECKGTHALVATHDVAATLRDVHRIHPARFWNDQTNPWFGGPRETWAAVRIQDPWLLVRKDIVPGSTGIQVKAQPGQLARDFPKERLLLPAEFCYVALLRHLETGERMCASHIVRFHVQDADGDWVGARWLGDRLRVDYWHGHALGNVGSASARAS